MHIALSKAFSIQYVVHDNHGIYEPCDEKNLSADFQPGPT